MPIQLGTVAAIGFENFPPAAWLGALRDLGCTSVQAYRNQNRRISVAEMQNAIAAGEMPCDSLHGVFGEQFDPSSPDEAARRFAVDTYKREGELAMQLGGPLCVVHCSTIRRNGIDRAKTALRWSQLARSIEQLGAFGRETGVRYAFENLPGYHAIGADAPRLAAALAEIGAPNTGLCFDTGHAHMVGGAAEALRACGGQVLYVHLSDNSGKGDDHDMPTYGTLDTNAIADALKAIGYSGTAMLEVFYPVERLRKLIDEGCGERLAAFLARANASTEELP